MDWDIKFEIWPIRCWPFGFIAVVSAEIMSTDSVICEKHKWYKYKILNQLTTISSSPSRTFSPTIKLAMETPLGLCLNFCMLFISSSFFLKHKIITFSPILSTKNTRGLDHVFIPTWCRLSWNASWELVASPAHDATTSLVW